MDDPNITSCVSVWPTKWSDSLRPLDLIPCPTIVTYSIDGEYEMRTEVRQHKKESLSTNPNFIYCMQCLSVLSING